MLQGTLTLHDLRDVEAFCNAALDQALNRSRANLRPADHDDALAYLISQTWRLSLRYDHNKNPSFTSFARTFQPRFLVDFYRTRFLDNRNRRRYQPDEWYRIQQLVFAGSLDAPVERHPHDENPRTLGELLAVPDSSSETDSDSLIERANRERARHRTREITLMDQRLSQTTAA
jgi:hypothetical protein